MQTVVNVLGRKYEVGKAYLTGCVLEVYTKDSVLMLDPEVSGEEIDEYAELTKGIRIFTNIKPTRRKR